MSWRVSNPILMALAVSVVLAQPASAILTQRGDISVKPEGYTQLADPTTGQASGKRVHSPFRIVVHVDSKNRNQVETALRSELAAANVNVSQDEFVGAVDNAMKLLAGWTSRTALRGCSPSGQLCYVITCPDC